MHSPLLHTDPHAFGTYRLLARLGSGGMGTVYLARSPGGRSVALKTMHARIASEADFRTRFRLEADAARVIGGRFGADVVDADPHAETPWLATEYVLGPPLDDAVERAGPLPEPSVRALGAALCGALGQLHRSDVVHRDLKPSNIMVTAYGPKVIDFGIARAIGDDRLTHTGSAVGTPAFMSPEQATGQEHTSAGDVFALAGVLVFAATGRGPFGNGQAADLLYRVRYAEPDLTGTPQSLVPVLARCLAKDPAQRPTTSQLAAQLHDGAGEFADHLPAVVLAEIARRATDVWQIVPQRLPAPPGETHGPETAPGADGTTGPSRTGLSRRGLLMLTGGSVLSVAAAGAGTWAWLGRDETEQPFDPAPGPSVTEEPDKKHDYLWQLQVGGLEYEPDIDYAPVSALIVGDRVSLPAGPGLVGVDAKTGGAPWVSEQLLGTPHVATDGERLYVLLEDEDAEGNAAKPGGFPLLVHRVGVTDGSISDPVVELTAYNGVITENQLLCVADGVLYLAAGEGAYSIDGFLAAQSWSLAAVDAGTGEQRWAQPLPPRPDDSERLLFLAAETVGDRLVLLHEGNDGRVEAVVRDTGSGETVWDRPLDVDEPDRLFQPLATDDRHLYLGGGVLRALRLKDGKTTWSSADARPGRTYGPPAVKDGVVYAVEKDLGVVAFDAATGEVTWEEQGGDGAESAVTYQPVVGDRYVYAPRGSHLGVVDVSSHRQARRYRTDGNRFVAHRKAGVIIAWGGDYLQAYPLE
jgi:eukaryotic-like serine/threonine-protein kinase